MVAFAKEGFMKLYSLKIDGFRRIENATIYFDEATFLIGVNNVGKSSVLKAIEYLLSDKKRLEENDYFSVIENGVNKRIAGKVILEAEFRNVPQEATTWRGFKGRLFRYESTGGSDTGYGLKYKKTYEINKDVEIQMLQSERILKEEYKNCKTIQEYINNGLDIFSFIPELQSVDVNKKVSTSQDNKIKEIEDLYSYNDEKQEWVTNPGGIPGNVLSKLPKYILIPAQHATDELDGKKGAFIETLNELFQEVRNESENFKQAQHYLDLLSGELNASDETTEIGKMVKEIDGIISDIFPSTKIHATTNLNDPNKAIQPDFNIEIHSNVRTPVQFQGTGVIRSVVFALLRYKNTRDLKKIHKGEYVRPLLIGFEEPELYLHPSAAQKMRETIYSLAEESQNQIVCTTHSTYMIDLSQKPSQILNNLTLQKTKKIIDGLEYPTEYVSSKAFNITKALHELTDDDDKTYVKMLMRFDDEVTKVFFANNVLIVEGDTEYLLLIEALKRMDKDRVNEIKANWNFIRARGKPPIISLIKYFKALNLNVKVIFDKDNGKENAEKYNAAIISAIDDSDRYYEVERCIEELLGYKQPSNDKPFHAYKFTETNWGDNWESISEGWRNLLQKVFDIDA